MLEQFVLDLESGALTLECDEEALPRIRELALRYAYLPFGFADANVISCVERSGGGVLTLDRRDLDVVAGEEMITPCPERGRTPEVRFTRSGRKLLPHYRAYRMVMF
jgi:hypothetical protein